MAEFEASWNAHEEQLMQESQADVNALEEAQAKQLMEVREELEQTIRITYKPSSQLLQNKNVFNRLIQQKKYTEAHHLREEIQHMEVQEQERHEVVREKKIVALMEKQMKKHEVEKHSLKKKLINQRHEQ